MHAFFHHPISHTHHFALYVAFQRAFSNTECHMRSAQLLLFFWNEKKEKSSHSWWDLIFFCTRTIRKITLLQNALVAIFAYISRFKRERDDGMRHVGFFHYPLLLLALHAASFTLRGLIAVEKKHRKQNDAYARVSERKYTKNSFAKSTHCNCGRYKRGVKLSTRYESDAWEKQYLWEQLSLIASIW